MMFSCFNPVLPNLCVLFYTDVHTAAKTNKTTAVVMSISFF